MLSRRCCPRMVEEALPACGGTTPGAWCSRAARTATPPCPLWAAASRLSSSPCRRQTPGCSRSVAADAPPQPSIPTAVRSRSQAPSPGGTRFDKKCVDSCSGPVCQFLLRRRVKTLPSPCVFSHCLSWLSQCLFLAVSPGTSAPAAPTGPSRSGTCRTAGCCRPLTSTSSRSGPRPPGVSLSRNACTVRAGYEVGY